MGYPVIHEIMFRYSRDKIPIRFCCNQFQTLRYRHWIDNTQRNNTSRREVGSWSLPRWNFKNRNAALLYPPNNEVVGGGGGGGILVSVRPSVCAACRVRSVTSTVLDGFFPYLVQIITSKRRCVACDDLWPWPISSSLGRDLENRVRSVASTVLDGFFLYLAQMITIIRGCVVYRFFQNLKIWIFGKFLKFFGLDLEK